MYWHNVLDRVAVAPRARYREPSYRGGSCTRCAYGYVGLPRAPFICYLRHANITEGL